MHKKNNLFAVGAHRPVYLWAGPGTVRMNRLKFMNAPVDEQVHAEAHTARGAQRMADEAGFNWAYLTYDWGFPPEVEQEDWTDFRRAVAVYHDAQVRVFGYVQTSNCVYDGSYRAKDWYAQDSRGRLFYYYTGRYMTCWTHPDWLAHLREITRGIVEAGADGVFYDNPWYGAQPIHFGGAWLGPTGCYCARCRAAFRAATGLEMPERVAPETDERSRVYLRWRAAQVTATLAELANYARSLNPEIVISSNDFDAVMRPSYLIYGIDLQGLSAVQDVIMIEDYGLPRWEMAEQNDEPLLVNNALTLRTARALIGDTPLSTDPYDKGIGMDAVYSARRFQQGIAEAAACGAAMVVKGTEYVEDGAFTLLTAEQFALQREAIGEIHHWLAENTALYESRANAASVGILFPGDALWQTWDRVAALYFGLGQTLLVAGIPWRVVTPESDWVGLKVLLHLGESEIKDTAPPTLRTIDISQLRGWEKPRLSFLARHDTARAWVSDIVSWLYRAYFEQRWARRLGDKLGLVHFFLQTPYFRLPSKVARRTLLNALGERPYPRVTADAPMLVELWQQGEQWQLHLVNYANSEQRVTVEFSGAVYGQIISPDSQAKKFSGARIEIPLDVYDVLQYTER